ncbi:MAG: hypothetical protein QF363_13960 [Planctomycetaceae bacterium]|nr:hypothetical protein [Planctomycetaceae bacterium]
MSDETTTGTEGPFSADDIQGFDADDKDAGRSIGIMLSLMFIYTVLAMSIVGVWTSLKDGSGDAPAPAAQGATDH